MICRMTYFLLVSGLSLAVLVLLMRQAPRGWQDQDGFHLGDEPHLPHDEPSTQKDRPTTREAA